MSVTVARQGVEGCLSYPSGSRRDLTEKNILRSFPILSINLQHRLQYPGWETSSWVHSDVDPDSTKPTSWSISIPVVYPNQDVSESYDLGVVDKSGYTARHDLGTPIPMSWSDQR